MRVLVLGASGLIGGNLMRLLQKRNEAVLGTYFSYKAKDCVYYNTLDKDDPANFEIDSFKADVVVHCGALTWVDYCEENEKESHLKTVVSTQSALDIAKQIKAKFVYLSTDYVFDGEDGPYAEHDKTNPLSVYGRHKLEAEHLVQNSGLDSIICRVTNVYGDEERGKNFIARLVDQAKSGEKLEMFFPTDQYATPVNAADVARAILNLLESDKSGIYHLASTDFLNRLQLAKMVLKHFPQNNISVKGVLTKDMHQKAERPLTGGLKNIKFLNEFPNFESSNVSDYVIGITKK